MKKTKMMFAVLFLAIIITIIAGCGSDSNNNNTPGVLTVTTAALPGVTVNMPYSQTLAASGGTAPYTWSISAGALPAGLNLVPATGVISGTPTAVATANFTVSVTDSATPAGTATKALSIAVTAPGALTVTTASLPAGTVNTAYNQTLSASGGTVPYTWSISVGALPAGLFLNSATGAITGSPTAAATTNFTVRVADSATPAVAATKPLSITVASSAPGVPSAPTNIIATGGTNSETISWNAVAGATSYNLYWLPSTGVTTATGTKITLGNVTSTTHSRLTATPTWLAPSTPYFYIVTAVNAAGESTASSQATATTSATDGVALYGTNCSGCHPALSNPAGKHGRSASTIQNAINANTGGMGSLSTLTTAQVQAIADVLVVGF